MQRVIPRVLARCRIQMPRGGEQAPPPSAAAAAAAVVAFATAAAAEAAAAALHLMNGPQQQALRHAIRRAAEHFYSGSTGGGGGGGGGSTTGLLSQEDAKLPVEELTARYVSGGAIFRAALHDFVEADLQLSRGLLAGVHFSTQLEPCLTHKNTLHTLDTP